VSDDSAFIAMKVSALAVDPVTGVPTVILTDEANGTPVPIGIGLGEASAIAAELDDIDLERPLTHQLMADLLSAAGARVVRIELGVRRPIEGGMCVASILIETPGGRTARREARASDALALALRCSSPVWVSLAVLERAARQGRSGTGAQEIDRPDLADLPDLPDLPDAAAILEHLGDDAFGKWKM
jgi:hypothetical protein